MRYSEQWKLGNTRSRSQKKSAISGFFFVYQDIVFRFIRASCKNKEFPTKKVFCKRLDMDSLLSEKKPQNHFIPIPKKSVI